MNDSDKQYTSYEDTMEDFGFGTLQHRYHRFPSSTSSVPLSGATNKTPSGYLQVNIIIGLHITQSIDYNTIPCTMINILRSILGHRTSIVLL